MTRAPALGAMAWLVAGCSLTEIVVVIDSDFLAPSEMNAVLLEAAGPSTMTPIPVELFVPDTGYMPQQFISLLPSGPLGDITLDVRAFDGPDCRLARTVHMQFSDGESQFLHVPLLRSCMGCNAVGVTCRDCGETTCGPGDLDPWEGVLPPFTRTPPPGHVTAREGGLWAGDRHTCALGNGSEGVWCWGENIVGQASGDRVPSPPVEVSLPVDLLVLATGASHTCAAVGLGGETHVHCWGDDSQDQLGQATTAAPSPVPVRFPTTFAGAPRDIAAGNGHTCLVLTSMGTYVRCWGAPSVDRGQLGVDADPSTPEISEVELDGNAEEIDSFADHTCALIGRPGRLFCWGSNGQAQLGVTADDLPHATPREVASNVTAFAAGSAHTCVVPAAPTEVRCWGAGNAAPETIDFRMVTPALSPIRSIDAGATHTCIVADDGRVVCWGGNESWQARPGIGLFGADGATVQPGVVLGDTTDVVTGSAHSCARVEHMSSIYCWGSQTRGETGMVSTEGPDGPVRVLRP